MQKNAEQYTLQSIGKWRIHWRALEHIEERRTAGGAAVCSNGKSTAKQGSTNIVLTSSSQFRFPNGQMPGSVGPFSSISFRSISLKGISFSKISRPAASHPVESRSPVSPSFAQHRVVFLVKISSMKESLDEFSPIPLVITSCDQFSIRSI